MALFMNNFPHTDEGAKLELTQEQEEFCRAVYKLDEEGGAAFAGFWNPDKEYSDEYIIMPLRSVYNGIEDIEANTCFANVIGSTGDPLPQGYECLSWMKLWVDKANGKKYRSECCTDSAFYYSGTRQETKCENVYYDVEESPRKWKKCKTEAKCKFGLNGGHVIKGTESATEPKGGNVYILPICILHNRAHLGNRKWGQGYYMKTSEPITAVKLTGYFQKAADYIK